MTTCTYRLVRTATVVLAAVVFCCQKSEAEVKKEDMFPYGVAVEDSTVPRVLDGFIEVNLKAPFKFFKEIYTTAYVGTNGIVSFKQGVTTFTPICGALPASFNGTMIAPYWADSDIRYERGAIYYRETDDLALRQKAIVDIKKAFPHLSSVDLTSLFIVTWDDIPYYLSPGHDCVNNKTTNTFQLILSTDDVRSFAIAYYNELTWSASQGPSGQLGDCYGLNGRAAKAGFDVGDGATFYEIPGTCSEDVLHLKETSNMGESGKWIFGVNDDFVEPEPEPTTSSKAPVQEFSCKSRANGLYPNVGNCRTFYKCSNQLRYLYDCPANLNFDHVTQNCDWPASARCALEYE